LDTANFRRTLAGICLITQPFINLISVAISPQQSTNTSEQLTMIGANPTRFLISSLLDLLWLLLLIPAVLGLLHLLRTRARRSDTSVAASPWQGPWGLRPTGA
jgi:hypothetical protein